MEFEGAGRAAPLVSELNWGCAGKAQVSSHWSDVEAARWSAPGLGLGAVGGGEWEDQEGIQVKRWLMGGGLAGVKGEAKSKEEEKVEVGEE